MIDVLTLLGDCLILLLSTARLTRLVVTDDLGFWLLRSPAVAWAERGDGYRMVEDPDGSYMEPIEGWRTKLVSGLGCPWCVGFWIAALSMVLIYLAGGPGDTAIWWKILAGSLALNYLSTAVGARLGDFD